MQYILTQNQQQLFLGPFDWKQRYIQSEINDLIEQEELTINFQVPSVGVGYINIGDGFEIFPITAIDTPTIDSTYEDPIGPFYTYTNNEATQIWQKQDSPISDIQGTLIKVAAAERYRRENLGTSVTIGTTTILAATDKVGRLQYTNLLSTIGTSTINFKTASGFINMTSADIQTIVTAVHDYIQAQFDWELSIVNLINAAITITELKAIIIVKPVVPPTMPGVI